MKPEDLFTTLPRDWNCITLPMQDADAFHRDILELSRVARDRQDFTRLLAERRDARQQELWNIWFYTFRRLASSPRLIDERCGSWPHAMHIYHSKSFDSYVRYFAELLPPIEPNTDITSSVGLPTAAEATTKPTHCKHTAPSDSAATPANNTPSEAEVQDLRSNISSRPRRNKNRFSNKVQEPAHGINRGLRRSSRIKDRNERSLAGGGTGFR
ncbi:hypothetical protein J7T55_012019 [Diaporthe amygdali]|uniref:uncharacterized protein n=1 Tax=Phomopsis amygdali TaxID=1214568 RepID=UPI0022FDBC50|nr:uncharacterized protein J7T55_012019 [Diaporthe amygdali]KAJ0123554.1 hypothetical protein J7T55_012019 [Diaporthe amygdali]